MPSVGRTPPALVQANGITLCCDTFGSRTAPPLLLIMGLGGQMIAWDDQFCTQLAERGYRVIRFDNRDIGLSTRFDAAGVPDVGAAFVAAMTGRPVQAPYTLRDMADDTAGLLDALDIERAHVVGVSMGGAIGQTLAIHHPARVRTLTSIMSTTGAPGLPGPTAQAAAVLLRPAPTDRAGYVASYSATWKVLRAGDFPVDEARDAARAEQAFDRGLSPAGTARQLAAILASGSRKEALASLRVPTLVVHGDADPLVPLACGFDTATSVPGARLRVIEGMGHALPVSMWTQLIDVIADHAV
jgi:pimeloyl-ACP methyl ester carboxylesterase